MAETVEKEMELFAASILTLKKSTIFTELEISKILNKVKKEEEKMSVISKRLADFRSAIKYDLQLLLELKRRRMLRHESQKNTHLDWIFINRIAKIYQRGLKYFGADYKFNIEYFEFLRGFPEEFNQITRAHVKRMIQTFSRDPNVFRKAADWFVERRDFNEARTMLFLGQSRHPEDLQLYLDLIEIEIKNIEANEVQKRLKKIIDEVVQNQVTHRFLEETLKVFDNYDNLRGVVDYAIVQMLLNYSSEVEVWNCIALRELKGDYHPSGDEYKRSTLYSIERTILRYKEGISKLPLEKKPVLWKKYLDTLIGIEQDYRNHQTTNMLNQALRDAAAAKIKLDEHHYLAWMDCCSNNDAYFLQTLQEGTKEHSTSVMLWSLYIKHYILKDDNINAEQVFKSAVHTLGSKSYPIWDIYLNYKLLNSSREEHESLYKKAITNQHSEISTVVKARYLHWTLLTKGIEAARELYLELSESTPYSIELHKRMFEIEQMESVRGSNLRTQILVLWTKQFGTVDVDVYFHRIRTVKELGGPNVNEQIREIYDEALKNLSDHNKELFKERFDSKSKY